MNKNVTTPMEVAISAAIGAGSELLNRFGEKLTVTSKDSARDIVSDADFAAESRAIEIVRHHFPNARVLSEEKGETGDKHAQDYWIIDALDGTVNYIHEVPLFSVSVAYFKDGRVQAGSIFLPLADDIYYAARGLGAFKNKHTIKVHDLPVEESLFAASFSGKSFNPNLRQLEFIAFGNVNDSSCGCLRTGSAALNLAFLAEGRLNGCWGKAAKYWDIAAGLLLAEEAGALVDATSATHDGKRLNYIAAPVSNFSFLTNQVRICF
jgi:myo-inositol-1(or 4)-monophosphatase